LGFLVTLCALAACVVNPVTGQREVGFVSLAQQISIGEQHYVPAQQMQGGQYRVDAELTEYVRSVGMRVAEVSGVELPYEFVVLNNSVPNAWALPGGKLAVNRGLLTELNSEAELAAVLGHEVVHAAGRHGARAMERGIISQAVLLGVAIGARNSEYAGLAVGGAMLAAGLLNQRYGRDAEREADYYGTRYMAQAGYDPEAAVALQETFVRLSEGRSTSWLEGLFASHPPSTERVANNRSLARQLRAEGLAGTEQGVAAYQAATRQIREDAEAYRAADDARKAMAEERYEAAEALLERAITLQDREAAFYGLMGDLRLRQKRYDAAVEHYDAAIRRDDEYFAYFLGRGLARSERGDRRAARADLDRSVQLLPTAIAYRELGRAAEADGDIDTALAMYQAAGQSDTAVGRSARERAVRLDLPRNPAGYLEAALSVDGRGRLMVQVPNRTGVPVADVRVRVALLGEDGRTRNLTRGVRRIEPGQAASVVVLDATEGVRDAQARVVQARVAD
jgi:beta-barrel assembly-enhancing protease